MYCDPRKISSDPAFSFQLIRGSLRKQIIPGQLVYYSTTSYTYSLLQCCGRPCCVTGSPLPATDRTVGKKTALGERNVSCMARGIWLLDPCVFSPAGKRTEWLVRSMCSAGNWPRSRRPAGKRPAAEFVGTVSVLCPLVVSISLFSVWFWVAGSIPW
jgi:hypothetical protein